MSKARCRALTPPEALLTLMPNPVEMGEARCRALTHSCILHVAKMILWVEMDEARCKALTPKVDRLSSNFSDCRNG